MFHRVYHQYLPRLLFILTLAWTVIIWRHPIHPPIGTYIAASAFLAIIVTIWPPEKRWGKAMWIVAFLGLTLFEVQNLFWDRDKHDKEQAKARSNEAKAFQRIADDLAISIREDREAFETTMQGMRGLTSLSGENLKMVSGGNSYCYMDIMENGSPIVVHQGKYPLYDVEVRVTDLNKLLQNVKDGKPADISSDVRIRLGDLAVGKAWTNVALTIPFSSQDRQGFNIFFGAKNGVWTELLRMRKISGHWERAMKVSVATFGADSKYTEHQVKEEVSKLFPKDDLLLDRDWQLSKKSFR